MLHLAMAAGLVAGLLFGLLAALTDSSLLLAVVEGARPLGTLFINAVRMIVIPLVAVTIFVGVVRLGNPRKLGAMGGLALAFFWGTTLPAILLGMGTMRALLPFASDVELPAPEAGTAPEIPTLVEFLVDLVPANPIGAAAEGDLLGLIVFTTLFAAAVTAIPEERRLRLLTVGEDLSAALVKLVFWVLWTAPLGIFALSAPVTATSGMDILRSVGVFIGAVVLALALFVGAVYLPLVRFLGRLGVAPFLRGAYPGMVVGFSTTSSVATLPVLLESADDLGVSAPVASLVISLGAAINRAGSALFQGASVLFLAHLYGVDLGPGTLAACVLAVFLTSMSVAPIPSASVMTLAPALETAGVPLAGLAFLLGFDRIPDMFRSAVNMTGHQAAAVVVEGLAGEPGAGGLVRPPSVPPGPHPPRI